MGITRTSFGAIDGSPVDAYEIHAGVLRAKVITYGAILSELYAPDRNGRSEDIVLGYDDLDSYLRYRGSAGAVCGRYANRIAKAQFTLDGETHSLTVNEAPNHIHGGSKGFNKQIWNAEADEASNTLRFTLDRPDGDEGYPGRVEASVTYRLTAEPALEVVFEATTDKPTVINMVHHGYWNLAGHGSGNVCDQLLLLEADHYTPVGPGKIPTGEIAPVAGTAFDFGTLRPIGAMIDDLSQLPEAAYDHNFCINGEKGTLRRAAHAADPRSGRGLEIWTDQPGVQFYTANHFEKLPAIGKGGVPYGKHAGFALETQVYPNSPNEPHFPSAALRPGEIYRHVMRVPFFTL
ncbi:aldose epimerase family protein [Microvirga terricola]|uniref:Aldose 1-epimerase n=1 Tax=Microvirga terricola TaxID=2719797 RepID=A0ABX0V8M7_9HYPH|nr:aldose epimerase family protein [Microvirga terricola]NIX76202.1 galactose mutarotase [Microvirga terricola]